MPPSLESERATGRPSSSTPNDLGCQFLAQALDPLFLHGVQTSFTRSAAFARPSFERAFQPTTTGPFRQPLPKCFFSTSSSGCRRPTLSS